MTDTRANIKEIPITNLGEYLDQIPPDHSFQKGVIFRGQREDWGLIPSFFRFKDSGKRTFIPQYFATWEFFEQALLMNFKSQAMPFLTVSPNNDLEWLSLAQHHGIPTRLMDWTENPLIALFFAVEDLETVKEHDISVIWSVQFEQVLRFDPNANSPLRLEDLNDHLKTSQLYYPTHISPRVSAQRGCFTVTPLPQKNEDFIPLNERYGNFIKFIIPNDKREILKYQLDRIRIDDFTIYPDLEGVAKKLTWEIKREMRASSLKQ